MNVLNQYANKRTNFAKYTDSVPGEGVEFPALTFCFKPSFKPLMLKLHNVPSLFCLEPTQVNEMTQLILDNANMTWNEFCLNISYKLERDFTIDLVDLSFYKRTQLKNGINKFGKKEVEMREMFTKYNGLCYIMLSDLSFTEYSLYNINITMLVSFFAVGFMWCGGNSTISF